MSKESDNKAVVARWFAEFWGKKVNLAVIDEIAAPDMLLKYSLHESRRGPLVNLPTRGDFEVLAEGQKVYQGFVASPARVIWRHSINRDVTISPQKAPRWGKCRSRTR